MSERRRAIAWAKDDPLGTEFVDVWLRTSTLSATGVAIGSKPVTYRLDYALDTGEDFVTAHLRVSARSERAEHTLDLRRSPDGTWTANGTERAELEGALDCDLGLSPLTNSMPVLRHGLLRGTASVELLLAWVSVPDLAVHASRQRYTGIGDGIVRFDSLDDAFTAQIAFDEDGLVVDYPGIARRLTHPSGG